MNIEEKEKLKEEVKNVAYNSGTFFNIYEVSLSKVLKIIDKFELDQPKLEVPQFVADWFEAHKENLEYDLYLYQISIYDNKTKKDDFYYWMQKTNNPVHKLINMHQFGYTVKKEKLYTVEIPNPNGIDDTRHVLIKNKDGSVRLAFIPFKNFEEMDEFRLTEQEIKKDFEWALKWKKEVAE